MKTLNVIITNKVAFYSQRGGEIVCGNSDYQIKFTFDSEWSAYSSKTARFKWNGAFYDVPFTGDTVTVPRLSNTTELKVGVYAGELSTSTSAIIKCVPSCLCGTTTQAPGADEPYYAMAKEEADRAEAAAKTAAADAAAGLVDATAEAMADELALIYELRGENLIDADHISTGALTESGGLTASSTYAGYCTTDFIKINGEKHIVSAPRDTGGVFAHRTITLLYDAEKNVIADSYVNESVEKRVIDNAEAVYLRVSMESAYFSQANNYTILVEKGDTVTHKKPFSEKYVRLKVPAENIVPPVSKLEQAAIEAVESKLFDAPKNLFVGATLKEGYINSITTGLAASASYNCFRGLILQPGNYAVYPQCRYVTNLTAGVDISKTAVTGVYTFSVEEESEIDISFSATYTDRMVLYNADLYSYLDIEKYYQRVLDTDKVVIPEGEVYGNVLYKKKWVACGDSFTQGVGDETFSDGMFKGKNKVYPYFIGARNKMNIVNEAVSGSTMSAISGGAGYFADTRYKNIPADADYITLWFGINDSHASLTIGTIDDKTTATFYGAWNVVMEHLITNHPFAKIGIVITNGASPEYTAAERAIAKKWGVPYLDMELDYQVPLMHRVNERPEVTSVAKTARMNAFRVSETDHHPNARAHEYQSTFIEAWLRTL